MERPASVARVSFWAAAFVQARASFGMPACPLISLLTPAFLSNSRGKLPDERKQRIAIVMSGKLGSVQGSLRTSHDSGVDPTVFRVAAHCWKRHVAFDDNVLTFVHSWDVEANTTVMNELRPVRALFEKQRSFEDYPNNHGWSSQWFSRRRALELVRQYEKESRRPFDWVYLTRFDSCHCAKLGTRTPAIPINLDHHRMPANIQLNAAFMGAFIETRDGNKLVNPNRSAFGNTGSCMNPKGNMMLAPRFADGSFISKSHSLHRLSEAMIGGADSPLSWVKHTTKNVHAMFNDPHALLGAALCSLFNSSEVEVVDGAVEAYRTGLKWYDWSQSEVLVRQSFSKDCLHDLRRGSVSPQYCYDSTCLPPAPPPPPYLLQRWFG